MAECDPLTKDEIKAMADTFAGPETSRNRLILYLGVATGYRISELLRVQRRHVLDNFGYVRDKIAITETKNGETRTVMVSGEVQIMIEHHLRVMEKAGLMRRNDWLFYKSNWEPIDRQHAWRIMKTAAYHAGITEKNIGTHSMRKTFGAVVYRYYKRLSRTDDSIDPLIKTMQMLGHKTLESTRHYLAFLFNDNTDAFNNLGKMLWSIYPKIEQS